MATISEDLARECGDAMAGWAGSVARRLVHVKGPDSFEFLHRISSQDVEGLAAGASAPACFLTPKGKLVATTLLGRDADGVWVEAPSDSVAELAEYLDRFHFTEKLEMEVVADRECAGIYGERAFEVAGVAPGSFTVRDDGIGLFATERFGVRWVHAHGPAAALDSWRDGLGLAKLSDELAACLRLATVQIVVGHDADDKTIALEAPVEDHISTTKGCYTGQEIVARIHTYGHVNRRLVLLRVAAADGVEEGATLCELEDGDPVGRVTSSATLPGGAAQLALGYVPREFAEDGAELRLDGADGVPVTVVANG